MNVAPGGLRYGVVSIAAGLAVVAIVPLAGVTLLVLGLGVVLFHRDPDRAPAGDGVLAPADGTVSVLRREDDGRLRVGTFMNVHDVHVNRAPLSGTVREVEHLSGAHRPAFTKSSDRNERVHLDLETPDGELRVTLIAGAFARRIHPYVRPGDEIERGERIGHISFGSRVDVLFPPGVEREDLAVERDDTVRAGSTVLLPDGS